MKRRWYALWFVAAYMGFLIASLPAGLVYGWVVPGNLPVRLTGLTGSVWAGEAKSLESGAFLLAPIQWSFRWRSLLAARVEVAYRFGFEQTGVGGVGSHGSGRLGLVDLATMRMEMVKADFVLAELAPLVPIIPPGLPGRIRVNLERFVVTDADFPIREAKGTLELLNLASGPPMGVKLGTFHMVVKTLEKGEIRARIRDRQGPLITHLNLRLTADGRYRLRGTLAARDASNANLRSLLRFVARPISGGRFQVEEVGRLPPLSALM